MRWEIYIFPSGKKTDSSVDKGLREDLYLFFLKMYGVYTFLASRCEIYFEDILMMSQFPDGRFGHWTFPCLPL